MLDSPRYLVKLEKLAPDEVSHIRAVLAAKVQPFLVADVSSYAPGRNRVWMPYEAPLDHGSSHYRPFVPGLLDAEVWQIVQDICGRHGYVPDVCLISRGGGIRAHRDTTYASAESFAINLGACSWHISSSRSASKPDVSMQLSGGEVFSFNCKHVHAVSGVAEDRWSINAWSIANSRAAIEAQIPQRLAAMLRAHPEVRAFIAG
jgi:hypothetical protein